MAGAGGDTLSETPGWRIAVLVAAFIVITIVWEKLSEMVEHHLSSKNRVGLRHIVHKLEEELLALGLISLLLIVLQESLEKICVTDKDYDKDAYGEKGDYGGDTYGDKTYDGRRLLAAGAGYDCGAGKESFWSVAAMHQAHLFIFTLAVTHIVYAMLSMMICLSKLKRWERWEKSDHELREISDRRLLDNTNSIVYSWHILTATFMDSVDRSVYIGLRRLFIERMNLTDSFNFHQFLVTSMEEEFSKVVKLEWFMWLIVGIWILTPPYLLFIMTGIAIAVMMAVATHLEFVAVKLTNQAYKSYATPPVVIKRPSLLRKSLAKLSARGKKPTAESKEVQTYNPGANEMEGPNSEDTNTMMYNYAMRTMGQKDQAQDESEVAIDIADGQEAVQTQAGEEMSEQTKEQESKKKASKHDKEMEKQRVKTFAVNYAAADSAQLFWFRRPRLMLRAVQYTYFETSLLLAILLFNIWQKTTFIISKDFGHPNWLTFALVMFGLLIMMHSAYFVLPLYALTMAAGSHCPESILKLAKKRNVQPQMVNALERLSCNPKSGNTATAGKAGEKTDKPLGLDWVYLKQEMPAQFHEDKNQTSLTTLLGAMYKEQTKNYVEAQRAQSQVQEASTIRNVQPNADRTASLPSVVTNILRNENETRSEISLTESGSRQMQAFGSFHPADPSGRNVNIDGNPSETGHEKPENKVARKTTGPEL